MSAAVTEATKKAVDDTKQEMAAAQAAAQAPPLSCTAVPSRASWQPVRSASTPQSSPSREALCCQGHQLPVGAAC